MITLIKYMYSMIHEFMMLILLIVLASSTALDQHLDLDPPYSNSSWVPNGGAIYHPCQALTVERCMNGGTCISKGDGFEGQIYSVDIDECVGVTCNTTTSTGCIDLENDYSCACKPGWTGKMCNIDIDECVSSPCYNGGTCVDHLNGFTCTCAPGYTGVRCELDIDECASNPCQNNATCHNLVNFYKCDCPPRMYGVNCDTNICHPTPADIVFLLDTSISMTEVQFRKQVEFVANLTNEVTIGPKDFQISVITFSTDARIEFYLNDYHDNVTLVNATNTIAYRPGTTSTHKALNMVKQVYSATHGIERRINGTMANRFVYLMTDGLSIRREETKKAAKEIKDTLGVTVLAIGIGPDVSHQELLDVASDSSKVYSVHNFNSLYTVLKRLVHFTCDECVHSAASDVVILVDTSHNQSPYQFDGSLDAITFLLDDMRLGPNDTRVSVTTFAHEISTVFGLDERIDLNAKKVALNKITQSSLSQRLEITDVLQYAMHYLFNDTGVNTRRFLLVFTNGNFTIGDQAQFQQVKESLAGASITVYAIGSGVDVNMQGLSSLVNDAYNVFITHLSDYAPMANLNALQSQFIYDVCNLKGE